MEVTAIPRSINHDIEESHVATRRREERSSFEQIRPVHPHLRCRGDAEEEESDHGGYGGGSTEGATVATEMEVTAEEVTAEEVMAAMGGAEVEVTVKEESDPDPGRGADRARAPLG